MSISYKDATEYLSTLQEHKISVPGLSVLSHQDSINNRQIPPDSNDKSLNIEALSLDSCGAQELMHCYQLALDFGVPTARRALALYQSRSPFHKEDS